MSPTFEIAVIALAICASAGAGYLVRHWQARRAEKGQPDRLDLLADRIAGVEAAVTSLDFRVLHAQTQIEGPANTLLDTLLSLSEGINRLAGRATLAQARRMADHVGDHETLARETGISAQEAQILMRFRRQ